MTFREKLMQEHPEIKNVGLVCPRSFGYEVCNDRCPDMSCKECWDREIPDTLCPSNPTTDELTQLRDVNSTAEESTVVAESATTQEANDGIVPDKPALGAKPSWLVESNRILDLCAAICRQRIERGQERKNVIRFAEEIILRCEMLDRCDALEEESRRN